MFNLYSNENCQSKFKSVPSLNSTFCRDLYYNPSKYYVVVHVTTSRENIIS